MGYSRRVGTDDGLEASNASYFSLVFSQDGRKGVRDLQLASSIVVMLTVLFDGFHF
jgi:hypothetical protein